MLFNNVLSQWSSFKFRNHFLYTSIKRNYSSTKVLSWLQEFQGHLQAPLLIPESLPFLPPLQLFLHWSLELSTCKKKKKKKGISIKYSKMKHNKVRCACIWFSHITKSGNTLFSTKSQINLFMEYKSSPRNPKLKTLQWFYFSFLRIE